MKKREGLFLLDALLGLSILSMLAVGVFPLLSLGAEVLEFTGYRDRLASEGFFAMDFMVEKIRNTLNATNASYTRRRNDYTYRAYNESGLNKGYQFTLEKEKLRLILYTGSVQPVTGETSGSTESYAFMTQDAAPLFSQDGNGPLHISYRMRHHMSGEQRDFTTSLVTYADYYRKGQSF